MKEKQLLIIPITVASVLDRSEISSIARITVRKIKANQNQAKIPFVYVVSFHLQTQ